MNRKFNTVFLASERFYPNTSAGGLRTFNLKELFTKSGIDAYVFALSKTHTVSFSKHILFDTCKLSENEFVFFISSRFRFLFSGLIIGISLIRHLASIRKSIYSSSNKPILIVYSTNIVFCVFLNLLCSYRFKIIYDFVEYPQASAFPYGFCDPRYWSIVICKKLYYDRASSLILISKSLKNILPSGVHSYYIPPLFNVHIDEKSLEFKRNNISLKNLVYPGNPGNKEDVEAMLRLLINIKSIRCDFVMNFTGPSWKRIFNSSSELSILRNKLGNSIHIHDFLPYQELISLYKRCHYLFFVRHLTQATYFNFPSKLAELMSLGIVPLVNSRPSYACYLIDDINSFILPDPDPTSPFLKQSLYIMNKALDADTQNFSKLSRASVQMAQKSFSLNSYLKIAQNISTR